MMNVEQTVGQDIDHFALAIDQTFETILRPRRLMPICSKTTFLRGLRNEDMLIELLRAKPQTFMQAIDYLRGLEDIYERVRGPKALKTSNEAEGTTPLSKSDLGVFEGTELIPVEAHGQCCHVSKPT